MKHPPWLLVPPGSIEDGAAVDLDQGEGRHAVGPLRLCSGDAVVIADGQGRVADAELIVEGRRRVAAIVKGVREVLPKDASGGLTLALAVIEGKAMDWAAQKAVEVGVQRFLPMMTARTQRGRRDRSWSSSHLERITRQALKQCRRPWAMDIEAPLTLDEMIERFGPAGGVVADPAGGALSELSASIPPVLVVGPEGGFSTDEADLLAAAGWPGLRLGYHVLRAETAAVVGGALMLAKLRGELE